MTPDLYDAWLTAGNNLQPIGDWLAANWGWITGILAGVLAAWALARHIRNGLDDYRTINDRAAADRITHSEDRPEPGTPGADTDLLAQCHAICPELARKEKPQP